MLICMQVLYLSSDLVLCIFLPACFCVCPRVKLSEHIIHSSVFRDADIRKSFGRKQRDTCYIRKERGKRATQNGRGRRDLLFLHVPQYCLFMFVVVRVFGADGMH